MGAMVEEQPPISVTEIVQLADLGILPDHVTWSRVTMTSDSYICIRFEQRQSHHRNRSNHRKKASQLMVLNLSQTGTPHKTWPVTCDSAKISPLPQASQNGTEAWAAIKTGNTFMVLRLEPQWQMVTRCQVDNVVYWTWINARYIGLVTDRYVLHWDTHTGEDPEKVFSRLPRLANTEIVSYKADNKMRWFALTGLTLQDNSVIGVTQLYSVDNALTQCITAHTVTFAEFRFEGNHFPSTVLCVACRDSDAQGYGKVHVIELGPHKPGNLALCSHYEHIKFTEDMDKYDFPVALQVSAMYGLLYVVTKYGCLFLCELESAACLCSTRISSDIVFTTTLNSSTEGIFGVSRNGKVLSLDLKTDSLVQYIQQVSKKANQADRLAKVIAQYSPTDFGNPLPETVS